MAGFLSLLFILVAIGFCIAAFKPTFFHRFGKTYGRKHLLSALAIIGFFLLYGVGVTSPPQTSTASQSTSLASQHSAQPAVQHTTKQVSTTKPVPFTTQNENDASLPQGQTQTKQAGVNGVETVAYQVNYTNGKETGRTQLSDTITTPAVPQIVEHGTYVAPAPVTTPAPAPAATPAPTISNDRTGAICNDGTPSTATGSGACSHHGGVREWLYN